MGHEHDPLVLPSTKRWLGVGLLPPLEYRSVGACFLFEYHAATMIADSDSAIAGPHKSKVSGFPLSFKVTRSIFPFSRTKSKRRRQRRRMRRKTDRRKDVK